MIDLGTTPYVSSFWIALVASGVLSAPILKLLHAMKSRQTVSQFAPEGHAKKQGTPTMGGLIVVAGFAAAMAASVFSVAPDQELHSGIGRPDRLSIGRVQHSGFEALGPALVLVLLFSLIGFVDDYVVPRVFPGKRGLGWKQKILMQLMAAACYAGLVYHDSPTMFGVAVFVVLFFSNAYNFADGLDALAGSILLSLAGGLAVIAFVTGETPALAILCSLLGAIIPFLFLNAPPAKVFMGDVGSLGIGAALGAVVTMLLAIPQPLPTVNDAFVSTARSGMSGPQIGLWLGLVVISLMMVVELVPVPLQIFSVKVWKRKLFPYTPIHHAFEKAGWAETRVVWCFALTQLLLSAAAIQIVLIAQTSAHVGL